MQLLSLIVPSTFALTTLCWVPALAKDLPSPPEPSKPLTSIDVRASQFEGSTKDHVALDTDAHGRTVAVWQSRRQQSGTYGIYARRFDANGTPLGEEVQVNLTTMHHQVTPAVALDADGSAWFVWNSMGQDGDRGSILARRFDATLRSSTNELLVNAERRGDQSHPTIDSDGEGNAVVVWEDRLDAGSDQHILGRRLTPLGTTLGDVFEVEARPQGSSRQASVSVEAAAGFVVAWARTDAAGLPSGIWSREFDSEAKGSAPRLLSSEEQGAAIEPAVCYAGQGGYIATWLEGQNGSYYLAYRLVRKTDAEMLPERVRHLAAPDSGYISGATVAGRSDGQFALAWNHYAQSSSNGGGKHQADLMLATFDANGEPLRAPFRAHRSSAGDQHLNPADGSRSLAYGPQGQLIVGWSGDGGFGDSKAAHLSIHAGEGQVLAASTAPMLSSASIADPAKPHIPPTYAPPAGVPAVDRTPMFHALTGGIGFNGIVNTGWTPPDPELAVGPNHLVMVTNGGIAYFSKAGTLLFSDAIEGSQGFWGNQGATGFVFDPEVRFDTHSNRFYAMACERGSDTKPYFLLAVSDDANPMGTWHKYRFNVQTEAGGDTDIDSPNMGIDAQAVYLTADFFGPDKFLVFIVAKSSILSGGSASTTSVLLTGKQSMGLPMMYGASPRQYMVWAPETSSSNQIEIFAINNPLGTPSLVSTVVSVPTYQQPENPPQQGTSIRPETFEARFWSATYRNGSLWATHHEGAGRILQRWYEIDMANWPVSGTPSLVQSGEVDPGPGVRTYFGSIAVDDANNMALTFARSATNEFISMGITSREASDPPGTTQPMIIAKQSTVADNSGRWGDYSGIAADPAGGGLFWAAHEFNTGNWGTWIQSLNAGTGTTNYCVTSPNSVGAGAIISSSGTTSVAANNLVLEASAAPSNISGLFFFGFTETQTPFGNGQLCVAGPIQRLVVTPTNLLGNAVHNLDLNSSQVGGAIVAGSTVKFQYWYRDPGVGQNFNLSDGLSATFMP